ncbi:MAG: flagellar hook-length control protein FliK [Alphaproteobacteria bacterium]
MELSDAFGVKNTAQNLNFTPSVSPQGNFISELEFSLASAEKSKPEVSLEKNAPVVEVKKETAIADVREEKAPSKSVTNNDEDKVKSKTKKSSSDNNSEKTNNKDDSSKAVDDKESKATSSADETEGAKDKTGDKTVASEVEGEAVSEVEVSEELILSMLKDVAPLEVNETVEAPLIDAEEVLLSVADIEEVVADEVNKDAPVLNKLEMTAIPVNEVVVGLVAQVENSPVVSAIKDTGVSATTSLMKKSNVNLSSVDEASVLPILPEDINSELDLQSLPTDDLVEKTDVVGGGVQAVALSEVVSDVDPLEIEALELSVEDKPKDLFETDVAVKSEKVVSQQNELAQKIEPENKLNVEVKVEEEGFDFSRPQIVVEDKVVDDKVSVNNLGDVSKSVAVKPNVLKPEVAVVAPQNTASTETAVKVNQDNINPIGFEVAKSNKATLGQVDSKVEVNDNLKGMSKEVIEQVKVNITKSAVKGVDVIDISLKPEELGKLSIKMEMNKKDGSVEVHIVASSRETMELLQKDMSSLQKVFEDAGFKLSDNSLSFSHQQENNQENNNRQARLDFMADAFSESEEDNQHVAYNGSNALNIKV